MPPQSILPVTSNDGDTTIPHYMHNPSHKTNFYHSAMPMPLRTSNPNPDKATTTCRPICHPARDYQLTTRDGGAASMGGSTTGWMCLAPPYIQPNSRQMATQQLPPAT